MTPTDKRLPALVFSLGAEQYGLRLEAVREIASVGTIQPVPRSPALFCGLSDVRGRMTTVIDLGELVGAGALPDVKARLMILAEPLDHLALRTSTEISLLELELQSHGSHATRRGGLDILEDCKAMGRTPVHLLSAEKILVACEREILKRYQVQ